MNLKKIMPMLIMANAVTLSATTSHALPLLAENAAQNVGGILTLYPDHENPNLFYFAPNSSALARSEVSDVPRFSLINLIRPSVSGPGDLGGYMTFNLKLRSNKEQKQALDKFLETGKKIATLPVSASTVTMKKNDGGAVPLGDFFLQFNYTRTGGTMESEIGANATLTRVGADVFKAAAEANSIFNMDYCYMIQGLGPNFDAKITVNMSRIYDHFKSELNTHYWWHKVDITAEVEKLIKNKNINIEINGGETKDRDYVYALTEKIVARIFVPELTMKPTTQNGGSGWSFSRFSLSTTHREEKDDEVWTFKGRENQKGNFCTNIDLDDVRTYKDQLIRDVKVNY